MCLNIFLFIFFSSLPRSFSRDALFNYILFAMSEKNSEFFLPFRNFSGLRVSRKKKEQLKTVLFYPDITRYLALLAAIFTLLQRLLMIFRVSSL